MPVEHPDVQMNLVRPKAPVAATVVSNESCMWGKSASVVKHTVFDVSGTVLEGAFSAGQSFGVLAPGVDDQGRPHKVRLYSLACPGAGEDGNPRYISTTPKRVMEEFDPAKAARDVVPRGLFLGVCSNFLCDLKPGDQAWLTGPQGKRFLLPARVDEHDYFFVATGTGIAPFRGMVLELLEGAGRTDRQVTLLMGAPYETDLLYHDLFLELAERHANFHYFTALSRQGQRAYVHHLVDVEMDRFKHTLEADTTLVYVCGLEGMERGLYEVLSRHALADGYFQPSARGLQATERCKLEVY